MTQKEIARELAPLVQRIEKLEAELERCRAREMTERSSPDIEQLVATARQAIFNAPNVEGYRDIVREPSRGELAKAVEAALRATQPAAPAQCSAGIATVSIKPMQLSDGRTDYFVSIKAGDREVTPHVFREEYKAAYHVALYDWLLNGSGGEPDVVEFGPDDWPARTFNVAQGSREAREKEITRLATIEECALIAEGFDAACNSPRMKLFEEAGLVLAIYKRDGEIGAAIRALAHPSTQSESGSPVGWGGHLPGKIEP